MVGKQELTFFDQSKKSGTKMDDRFGPPQWQSTSSSSQAFTKEKKPSCQTVFFHPPSLARTLPTNFLTISLGFIASSNLFDVVFIRTGNSVQCNVDQLEPGITQRKRIQHVLERRNILPRYWMSLY